jgi:hypothetical protein
VAGGTERSHEKPAQDSCFPHIPAAAEDTSVLLQYFSKIKRYSVLSLYYNTDRIAVTIQLAQGHSYHDPTVVTISLLSQSYFYRDPNVFLTKEVKSM